MKYIMHLDYYSGVDGSSISEKRCEQIIKVYDMLESMGECPMTYVAIQEEANNCELFGETKARSAIRTFFPLLLKIGFVNYTKEDFKANQCFTDLGKEFVLVCKALDKVDDLNSIHKEEIKHKLVETKKVIQQKGLINMYYNAECKSHNMWIALKLLKELHVIIWDEFLFTIYQLKSEKKSYDEIIQLILRNRHDNVSYEFVDENNKSLPNTCYSYIKAYLIESGIIEENKSGLAKITQTGLEVLNDLPL